VGDFLRGKKKDKGENDGGGGMMGGLFAAKKRVEVRIPGFIFTVSPDSVLRDDDEGAAAVGLSPPVVRLVIWNIPAVINIEPCFDCKITW
jgi:hypothetical protein